MQVKMYAVHITQKNRLKDVANQTTVDLIRKYEGAAAAQSKNPGKYLSSVLFRSIESQESFAKECGDIGLDVEVEQRPAFVDSRYLGQ